MRGSPIAGPAQTVEARLSSQERALASISTKVGTLEVAQQRALAALEAVGSTAPSLSRAGDGGAQELHYPMLARLDVRLSAELVRLQEHEHTDRLGGAITRMLRSGEHMLTSIAKLEQRTAAREADHASLAIDVQQRSASQISALEQMSMQHVAFTSNLERQAEATGTLAKEYKRLVETVERLSSQGDNRSDKEELVKLSDQASSQGELLAVLANQHSALVEAVRQLEMQYGGNCLSNAQVARHASSLGEVTKQQSKLAKVVARLEQDGEHCKGTLASLEGQLQGQNKKLEALEQHWQVSHAESLEQLEVARRELMERLDSQVSRLEEQVASQVQALQQQLEEQAAGQAECAQQVAEQVAGQVESMHKLEEQQSGLVESLEQQVATTLGQHLASEIESLNRVKAEIVELADRLGSQVAEQIASLEALVQDRVTDLGRAQGAETAQALEQLGQKMEGQIASLDKLLEHRIAMRLDGSGSSETLRGITQQLASHAAVLELLTVNKQPQTPWDGTAAASFGASPPPTLENLGKRLDCQVALLERLEGQQSELQSQVEKQWASQANHLEWLEGQLPEFLSKVQRVTGMDAMFKLEEEGQQPPLALLHDGQTPCQAALNALEKRVEELLPRVADYERSARVVLRDVVPQLGELNDARDDVQQSLTALTTRMTSAEMELEALHKATTAGAMRPSPARGIAGRAASALGEGSVVPEVDSASFKPAGHSPGPVATYTSPPVVESGDSEGKVPPRAPTRQPRQPPALPAPRSAPRGSLDFNAGSGMVSPQGPALPGERGRAVGSPWGMARRR